MIRDPTLARFVGGLIAISCLPLGVPLPIYFGIFCVATALLYRKSE